jgi:peptidoglycan/LPS O-acetylase OafA/YrhL
MTSGTVAACGLALSIHLYKYWPHWGISIETKLVLDSIISGQIVAWALAGKESRIGRLLQSRSLARLRDWSYSFYCFAMPIMVIVACFSMEPVVPSSLDTTFGTLLFLTGIGALTLAIVLPISYCSFRFIEGALYPIRPKAGGACANDRYSGIRGVQPETR